MFHTRVCDLFGIEYPILQAPMNYPVTPTLVAAVSNAGGLGILSNNMMTDIAADGAGSKDDPAAQAEHMREQIRDVRRLTDKPIGINLQPASYAVEPRIELAVKEGVQVAYTSMGSPTLITKRLQDAGIKVIHIGTTVRHAVKAQEAGVDAFAIAGVEAGGHSPGHGETTLFTVLPQVVDAVDIPVLAGGGVGDARGFIAALALGAEGICMGTRFLATHESRWHPEVKRILLGANDSTTVAWGKTLGAGLGRTMKNKFTEKYLDMEAQGATAEELQTFIDGYKDQADRGLDRKAGGYFDVDLEWGEIYMGAVSGLISELKNAADVVPDIIAGAEKVLARLHADQVPARL
jgi:NAD(P)H-dependent flavin oxidoreductase YrpB (nitropropane dioxygenase family)